MPKTKLSNVDNIFFPAGLEGLPEEWQHFKLEQTEEIAPVALLHCLDSPRLSLIVADPRKNWFPTYKYTLSPEDLADLKAAKKSELILMAVINVEAEPFSVTANLLAPIFINPKAKLGKQVILHNSPHQAKQPLTLQTKAITIKGGLLGMEEWENYIIQTIEELRPVKLLVNKEQPRLSYPVVDPWLVDNDYKPDLSPEDKKLIGKYGEGDLDWMVILTIQSDPLQVSANLLAPIAVNNKNNKARQTVLATAGYKPSHLLKAIDISQVIISESGPAK